MIGYDPGAVMYYQQHRARQGLAMPCTLTAQQQMQIQTASGSWQTYQTNPITATVSSTTVTVQRGQSSSPTWEYPYQE
jgi:hypothetical protein